MQVIENEFLVAYDIDDTIVMWDAEFDYTHADKVEFKDPYDGKLVYLTPNKKHIDLLKKHKAQGMAVMVWSAGGAKWARSVIDTLELSEYVDIILTKPVKFVDDLQASEILGQRIYLK